MLAARGRLATGDSIYYAYLHGNAFNTRSLGCDASFMISALPVSFTRATVLLYFTRLSLPALFIASFSLFSTTTTVHHSVNYRGILDRQSPLGMGN